MQDNIEKIILDFMKEAGEIALNYQSKINDSESYNKSEKVSSIVTEADIAVSDLFTKIIKENITDLNYVIIDEENLDALGDDKWKTIDGSEYQFVLDPIDGTLPYSLDMPMFGISVGILKNNKPYMGYVYAPALGELLYYNGENNILIKKPFTDDAVTKIIEPSERDVELLFDNVSKVSLDFDKLKKYRTIDYYSVVVRLMYIASNRAKGYYFAAYCWDMAGAWVILNNMSYQFFNIKTGEVLSELNQEHFDDNFRIKTIYIVCKEKDFDYLEDIATIR